MKPLLLLSILSLMVAANAFAGPGGSEGGGGGDTRCAQYADVVRVIAQAIKDQGQTAMNAYSPAIDVEKIAKVAQGKVRCIPVTHLDRQARSYPGDMHTDLLVSAWQTMTSFEKERLTSHELCVLAKIEKDGEYTVSGSVVAFAEYLRSPTTPPAPIALGAEFTEYCSGSVSALNDLNTSLLAANIPLYFSSTCQIETAAGSSSNTFRTWLSTRGQIVKGIYPIGGIVGTEIQYEINSLNSEFAAAGIPMFLRTTPTSGNKVEISLQVNSTVNP